MDRSWLVVLFTAVSLFFAGPLLVHWPALLPRAPAFKQQRSVGQVVRYASIATELEEHARALNASCAPNHIEFLGVGTRYESSRNKLDHAMHWIRTLDPDTLVVFIDSNDAICLPCDRDLRTEYLKLGYDIVFGGACYVFPDKSMRGWYPTPPEKPATLRKFLNAGTMMGRASAIQHYCTQHYMRPGRLHDVILRDQRFWTDQFLAGYNSFPGSDEPSIGIDYDGRLFQVLGPDHHCGGGCWGMNTTTGFIQVKPKCQKKLYSGPACILHGPGKGKPVVWNITANLDELRRSTDPWVDLH